MKNNWKAHAAEIVPLPPLPLKALPHTHQWEMLATESSPIAQEYVCACGASQSIEYDGKNKLTITAELMSKEEQESYNLSMRHPARPPRNWLDPLPQEEPLPPLPIEVAVQDEAPIEGPFEHAGPRIAPPPQVFQPAGPWAFPNIPGR